MTVDASVVRNVFSKIDQDELVQLAMTLADIHSPTGREQELANFILNWFGENGFYSIKQVVEEERFNAIGVLHGTKDGPSLTLNGHLDTMLIPGKPIEKAYVSDGRVYGNEIGNMKAVLATIMIAAKAIKEAGVQLGGDLIVATVVGEINTASVGPFQEPQDRGDGIGTRHLLANGIQSDYAIVADGTEYAIIRAQAGSAYFRITTKGDVQYSPFTRRPDNIYESTNAIVKMTKVIDTIENWAREYERTKIYKFPGGQVMPKVSINVIQGGMPFMFGEWRTPFKPSQTPLNCDLYVDVRIPPSMTPMEIKHELVKVLGGLPFEWEIEMFRSQRGYEGKGKGVEHLSSIVLNSYEHVFQTKPPSADPVFCSMWTDTNLYWEIGIPAVEWGPTDILGHSSQQVAQIRNLVQAAKVYSLIALEVCGEKNK